MSASICSRLQYKIGDKVLLTDPVPKKGETTKLKLRYSGPFSITDVLPNDNFRLQHLANGNSIRRPVHGARLRPLKELDNDYRSHNLSTSNSVASFTLPGERRVTACIYATAPLIVRSDAFVHVTENTLKIPTPESQRLLQLAGTSLREARSSHLSTNNLLFSAEPLSTAAGNLLPN